MKAPRLLDCVVLEPPKRATACVIWLHGLGANGHDFPPVVPMLGLPKDHSIRFRFPHAPSIPVTINGGMVMPAWYDILSMESIREVDEAGVRQSAAQLQALVDQEIEAGIPSERIILAGFSQGGAIALHQGLRAERPLGGLMLLSTYQACDGNLDEERSQANASVPIFQAHGTHDPMVRLSLGLAARERLESLGYPVEWHEYPMQHEVCLPEVQAIGTWLRGRLIQP
ncbi:MAG: carboxylesterase [Planctomycetes bacterium]|nr:carboxylesterase [Planctomycetota bacterium]MCB9909477.1 carboxylesterase [Planctomycetota bacterium]